MVRLSIICYTVLGICIILFIVGECIRDLERRMVRIKEAKSKMNVVDKIFYIIYEVSQYGFCTWEFCDMEDYKEITHTTCFKDLDLDENDRFEVLMELEEEFDLDIKDEEAEKWKTVQDIINYINFATGK